MSQATLPFSCSCGQLAGHISQAAQKNGFRLVCHCVDCRAAELYHNQPDPSPDGVDLFQLAPEDIEITQGAENLRLLRLGPKGLFRWYAGCCGTPFANTLGKPGLPFAGMRSDLFSDKSALGKIRAQAFIPLVGKVGKSATKTKGAAPMAYGIFRRMITSRLSGRWKDTPFFDVETGKPVAKATIPTKEERAALYK